MSLSQLTTVQEKGSLVGDRCLGTGRTPPPHHGPAGDEPQIVGCTYNVMVPGNGLAPPMSEGTSAHVNLNVQPDSHLTSSFRLVQNIIDPLSSSHFLIASSSFSLAT